MYNEIMCGFLSQYIKLDSLTWFGLAEVQAQVHFYNDIKITMQQLIFTNTPLLHRSTQVGAAWLKQVHENSNLVQAWEKATCAALRPALR